jgi:hypothetical protein
MGFLANYSNSIESAERERACHGRLSHYAYYANNAGIYRGRCVFGGRSSKYDAPRSDHAFNYDTVLCQGSNNVAGGLRENRFVALTLLCFAVKLAARLISEKKL